MKVGILLAGCGLYDGTEVAEAVLAALAVDRGGATPAWLAPEVPQMHTVDHMTGAEVEGERRDLLREAARVARGRIRSLAEQFPGDLAGLVIPGGHGTVKNLMTNFARLGEKRDLIPEVRALMADLVNRRAPIGSISLGRTIVRAYFDEPLSGDDMQVPATEVIVDEDRRLLFTPGFLTGASLGDVATGIEAMIGRLIRMPAGPLHVIH